MNYKTLIIVILIAGFSIIGSSVYVGINKRDAVVEENPYDAGLKFDETLRKQAELGWRVEFPHTFKTGDRRIEFKVFDKNNSSIKDASVELHLNRLGNAEVKKYKCINTKNGQYTADVKLDASGYWEVRVRVEHLNNSMRFDDRIYVQQD